jgi:Capsule assembly protein Wzi
VSDADGAQIGGGPSERPRRVGSPYVELDSWIYPAIERLAALGYIQDEFLGMRPWTRVECARLVQQAGDLIEIGRRGPAPAVARELQVDLKKEFQAELDALAGGKERLVRVESVYANLGGINGKPLNDSYHFGQTIINNFGRPYQEGFNSYDGASGYATFGRFTIYARGEYQHAPSAPAYSLPVRQAIATMDNNPLLPATPVAGADQFRLLDTYVSANVANWNLSFGKQSLWWGPGDGGALLFSDNAEPIYMARASRITPFRLPWIFRWLGPMKWDLFYGKLSGNQYPPRPMIHGEKISFKPTENLELGFSRTGELGGVGRPLTFGSLWRSYFSTSAGPAHETATNDPGKRTGGFDFNYRVPYARNWLSIYADSLSDDDPSPIDAPRRAGISPGIYLSRIPGISKLDLRVEAVNTNTPTSRSNGGKYIYYDGFYHDLYTNKNNIIGSWIGREGTGIQARSTYWFSPRNTLQVGYRHAKVASDFIPGGETVNDGSVKADWWIRQDLSVSAFVQYEKWLAPILAPTSQTNWTSSVEVTFWPRSWNW